jgi:hypothetical protein
LAARAKFEGERHEVFLRVAESNNRIYLDLADEMWRAIEIDASGWRDADSSPVRFRRTPAMRSLPVPTAGGKIDDLRGFVNLSPGDFHLYIVALIDALFPQRPHVMLHLTGEEGSGKSAASKIARDLTDPSQVPLRTLPNTVRDLFVSSCNSHTLAFDNVSVAIPPATRSAN